MTARITLFLILITSSFYEAQAQAKSEGSSARKEVPENWHQLDRTDDGFQGISLAKAYSFIQSKNLPGKKVVVAVIDSGIDTLHEDLKPVMWVNKREIPGNKIDDDKNGYVDDIHGWNFIGGKDGKNVKEDSYEKARVYHKLKARWESFSGDPEKLNPKDKAEYIMFSKAKKAILEDSENSESAFMKKLLPKFTSGDSIIRLEIGKQEYTTADLKEYKPTNADAKAVKSMIMNISRGNGADVTNKQLLEQLEGEVRKADAANTPPIEYRKLVVKDNEANINDKGYGNNDLMAETSFHGTHCSGIIGAARENGVGVDGIADKVEIMTLRAVPDGDEHDKDIALAIRYAVDNGARVISMSFGKDFSPEKYWVDDAFSYAEKKGVLLVHAAGNDSKNIDTLDNFPTPNFLDGKGRAGNVITVGASGDPSNGGITASFSNYGKKEVDVFAPGVSIYSTIPGGNTYGKSSGTSMACPVVSGIAALIMSYYPNLNAKEVKTIIEESSVKITDKVRLPGSDEETFLSEISRSGGIVNAYEALVKADEMSKRPAKPSSINQSPAKPKAPVAKPASGKRA